MCNEILVLHLCFAELKFKNFPCDIKILLQKIKVYKRCILLQCVDVFMHHTFLLVR